MTVCTGERGGCKDTQCVWEREAGVRIHRYTAVYVKVCVVDIYIEREK